MQQLLNPFAQKYPESTDIAFPAEAASLKFNPSGPYAGHYLATGGYDGTVHVWDVETGGVAKTLRGHVKAVGGLSWSRNNRYLLTASLDSTCIIWDLAVLPHPALRPSNPLQAQALSGSKAASTSSQRVTTIRLDAPVATAHFHPRTSRIVLATLTCHEVVLIDLRRGGGRTILQDVMEMDQDVEAEGEDGAQQRRGSLCCAMFSPCGSRIYAGTTKGRILIIDPVTRYVIQRIQVATSAIRQIAFDASGRHLLTSATDRALRLLTVDPLTGSLTPSHRFQDQVNRTPWHAIGFNVDSEYVMAGAGHKAAHNIFIWDRESGVLVKVLEGPKDSLGDCDWHPSRPVIASTTISGDIQIWMTSTPDNWAAFAPGFEELEENVEYDEREDEFDIEDETEMTRRKDMEEDTDIDIFRADDSYPRRPDPVLAIPPGMAAADEQGVETEVGRAVRLAQSVVRWVADGGGPRDQSAGPNGDGGGDGHGHGHGHGDGVGDGDTWEGFYLSLDLLSGSDPDAEMQGE